MLYEVITCLGTACYVRGSQTIMDTLEEELGIKAGETTEDGELTLEATRCIGACGLAPVFSIDDKIYGSATIAKAKQVSYNFV